MPGEHKMEFIILAAVVLDIIVGDPKGIPHPVSWIGKVINWGEKCIRNIASSPSGLKQGGILLSALVFGGTYLFFWGLLWGAYHINNYLGIALSIIVMSQALAINSLYRHAVRVVRPLNKGDLAQARNALAMIVGRDTEHLDEKEVVRGVVETVAENTVDGITAPLFYGFLGGPPLAMAYKAVNTMDSMIGYKNEKYLYLGWAGARLDDIANYIPARITGFLYLIIAPFTPGGFKSVFFTILRDASRHPSPNSGIPEAAVAGALQVQLGGNNYYGGVLSERVLIGQGKRTLEKKHIHHSLVIMLVISLEALILGLLITYIFK
jgi:adenosylcobinamide-phosphate synthase